uniref:KRAB domain-containing protein n=1 Tax=Amazona collaria TaxID=241587 RepID=A0A8B9F090_9PSIT
MSARRGAAAGGRRAARPRAGHGPVSLEDVWVQFSEREWRALRGWQQALHRAVMRTVLEFAKHVSGSHPSSAVTNRKCFVLL